MVRISTQLSSYAIHASIGAAVAGYSAAAAVVWWGLPNPFDWFVEEFSTVGLNWGFLLLGALWSLLLYPISFAISYIRLPKRIIFRDEGIVVYGFRNERNFEYADFEEIGLRRGGEGERWMFLKIKVAGRSFVFEVDHGQLSQINRYIPITIANDIV